jgi:hypothetical protein
MELASLPFNRWTGAVSYEGRGVRLSAIHDRVRQGPYTLRTPYVPDSDEEASTYDTTNILSVSGDVSALLPGDGAGRLIVGVGLRRIVKGYDVEGADGGSDDIEQVGLDLGASAGRTHRVGSGDGFVDWRLGAAWLNGVSVFADDEMAPESDLKLGAAVGLGFGEGFRGGSRVKLLVASDWTKSSSDRDDDQDWERRLGAEALFMNLLAVRIGSIDSEDDPFIARSTWGLGLVLDDVAEGFSVRVDYSRAAIDEFLIYDETDQDHIGVTLFMNR